jgi:hypothetical protein
LENSTFSFHRKENPINPIMNESSEEEFNNKIEKSDKSDSELNEFDWDPGDSEQSRSSDPQEDPELDLNLNLNQLNGNDDVDVDADYRIRALEEEQENLLSSLMALTTHFAQVQFRLHQIVEAPEKERDTLLKKLEDFADRGIPSCPDIYDSRNILNKMDHQKSHQHELIEQLKNQLEDLEKYAYETGEPVMPQSMLVEKQKVIIDELKQKMNLNFNELDLPQLTTDELRNHVDQAIGEFVSPLKMKEQLVLQLKTQVNDLERFIKFLQGEKYEKKMMLKKQILQKQKSFRDDLKETNIDALDVHDHTCNCNASNKYTNNTNQAAKCDTNSVAK